MPQLLRSIKLISVYVIMQFAVYVLGQIAL